MELKNKIFIKAEEMFMRYGAKSVTMDDISKALGISKKTLYQYVDNKGDLISKIITFYIERENDVMLKLRAKSKDAIEDFFLISQHVNKHLRSIQPVAMYDLQKYYTEQWEMMRSLNHKFIYNIIKENLEKGIAEDLYREDLRCDIVARLYVSRIDTFLDPKVFPFEKYTRMELHHEFIKYHLHAIVSRKGKLKIDKYYQMMVS